MATVTFRKIEKSFGDVQVVKGIDLEIADGEFLVLVGESGCGKSTLLRMIAGLERPTSGDILIGDQVVNDLRPRERDVAMVFQSYALYPHMTVRQNMGFGLRVRKESKEFIDKAVGDAAKLLGLEDLLDRKPKEMSGGQRQRVAMGRAIVRRPKVFLFDEPLSNLDASLRSRMRIELKRLHQELGVTTIYVTHDQLEAMTLADRIALMDDGVFSQVGTPAQLYEQPANQYTASFLGSPGMNFTNAELREGVVTAKGVELVANSKASGPVVLGVRPHDLQRTDAEGGVTGTVVAVEPMGWEAHVHVKVGDADWVARLETAEVAGLEPGAAITFRVAPASVRLFSADGAAI